MRRTYETKSNDFRIFLIVLLIAILLGMILFLTNRIHISFFFFGLVLPKTKIDLYFCSNFLRSKSGQVPSFYRFIFMMYDVLGISSRLQLCYFLFVTAFYSSFLIYYWKRKLICISVKAAREISRTIVMAALKEESFET